MKFLLTLMLFALTLTSNAQSKKNLTNQQFQNLILRSFDDLFSHYQIAKLDEYYTTDFLILEHGEVWNRDTLVNLFQRILSSGQKRTRTNRITVIEFERNGNSAWGSYWNEADISTNNAPVRKVKWLESAVLVREKRQWKIKLLHSTRI